mgnify:CR=1 FL=1
MECDTPGAGVLNIVKFVHNTLYMLYICYNRHLYMNRIYNSIYIYINMPIIHLNKPVLYLILKYDSNRMLTPKTIHSYIPIYYYPTHPQCDNSSTLSCVTLSTTTHTTLHTTLYTTLSYYYTIYLLYHIPHYTPIYSNTL